MFDEVVFVQQPWQSVTLGYNLPKTSASTNDNIQWFAKPTTTQ
jgi:hypothetical protein